MQTFLRRTTASVEKVGAAFGAAGLLVADADVERDAVDFDDDEDEDEEVEDDEDEDEECDLGACAKGGG